MARAERLYTIIYLNGIVISKRLGATEQDQKLL